MMLRTITLISAIFVASCTSALYKPLPENYSSAEEYQMMADGRKAYVTKCSGCHLLYLPHQYDEKTWRHNMDEMQERSNVTDKEKELMLKYILSAPIATKP
jgi:hypothetical protein